MTIRPRIQVPLALASVGLLALLPVVASGAYAAGATVPKAQRASPSASSTARANSIGRRYSFSRNFSVHGHVKRPNPYTTAGAKAFQRKVQTVDPKRVAIFGRVVSLSGGTLMVRQTPWRTHAGTGATLAYSTTRTPLGAGTTLIPVRIVNRTLVQSTDGLAALRPGTTVFVGGAVAHHQFSAFVISSLRKAAEARMHIYRALSGQRIALAQPLSARPSKRNSPHDTGLNFPGEFGGPSFNYNVDLGDIDIFDIAVLSVYLDKFSFLASLDGWTYNWPMNFSGTTSTPLVMTEQNTVNLNVKPQAGGSGTYTDTFSGGIGVNVGVGFHIYTFVGCGTADLESCDFYPTVNLGVGLLNETQDAAPLAAGTDLNVPSVDCPSVGLSIPDTSISAADVGICNTFLIHGANFQTDVSATNATMSPNSLSFDGTNAQSQSLTPTASPVGVHLNDFLWDPTLDYGLHPRIRVALQTIWTGPTVTITSGSFPMIADAATRTAAGFNDVEGQFAQPTSTDFAFLASKEGTHITYTGATSGDYHDAATVSATLTDNLSRPVALKTLNFALNGSSTETCTATTDLSGRASCSVTPTDVPAPGALSVTFGGDEQYLSSSATPSFTITREESAVHWTSASNTQDYHDAAPLTATLAEDSSGPAISGQTLNFTLGAQNCVSQSTDASGSSGCTVSSLNQIPNAYTGTASFAGNTYYLPSSDTHAFTITHEETTLAYTSAPFIANNRQATLSAVLKEDGTVAPVPFGQTVTLTIGTGPGAQSCAGITLSDGSVSCQISLVSQPLGPIAVSAVFAGDAYYVGSSDTSHQRTVFAFQPGGGAFSLGNCTAFTSACASTPSSSTLTWWSSQWWTLNSLSGGAAPSSFKGFAATASGGDPVCGGSWTTAPGNSSPPPASIPAYTAMVVPSAVTNSGSNITGNIPEIVIVHTNGGYNPNVGSSGTGTIVGVLCHS